MARHSKKRRMEFSKKLVAWALIFTTLCVALSFFLAYNDHDPCSDITVAVATACIAIAVSYEAKSYAEKNSRNKYGLDRNGNPREKPTDEEIGG